MKKFMQVILLIAGFTLVSVAQADGAKEAVTEVKEVAQELASEAYAVHKFLM